MHAQLSHFWRHTWYWFSVNDGIRFSKFVTIIENVLIFRTKMLQDILINQDCLFTQFISGQWSCQPEYRIDPNKIGKEKLVNNSSYTRMISSLWPEHHVWKHSYKLIPIESSTVITLSYWHIYSWIQYLMQCIIYYLEVFSCVNSVTSCTFYS